MQPHWQDTAVAPPESLPSRSIVSRDFMDPWKIAELQRDLKMSEEMVSMLGTQALPVGTPSERPKTDISQSKTDISQSGIPPRQNGLFAP